MKNRLWIFAILIALGLIGLNYWFTLNEQTSLPSEKWTRAFSVDAPESRFSVIQVVEEDAGYTISLRDFDNQYVLGCDRELDCEHLHTYEIFTTTKNTWSDRDKFYYYRNEALIRKDASGEEIIAKGVDNFVVNKEQLVYWTKEQEVVVGDQVTPFVEPIYDVQLVSDVVFVVTKSKTENQFVVYQLADGVRELFAFKLGTMDIVNSLDFMEMKDGYGVLAETTLIAGGSKSKTIQLAAFDLSENQQVAFETVTFMSEETGRKLSGVGTPSILTAGDATYVAFSASNQLYAGKLEGLVVTASAFSEAGEHNDRPTMLNEDTVLFFDIEGTKKHLQFASSDAELIEESKQLQDGDLKEALYSLISKVFTGFILIIFSFTWIVATLVIVYGLLVGLQKKHIVNLHSKIFGLFVLVLFISQAIFFTQMISIETLLSTLPFVESSLQLVGLLLGGVLLSVVPLVISKLRVTDESFNFAVMFTTLFNLVVVCLLIGPYMYG